LYKKKDMKKAQEYNNDTLDVAYVLQKALDSCKLDY